MAVGTGFGQVFKGIGKDFPSKVVKIFGLNLFYQAKSVESLFHRPFSSQG